MIHTFDLGKGGGGLPELQAPDFQSVSGVPGPGLQTPDFQKESGVPGPWKSGVLSPGPWKSGISYCLMETKVYVHACVLYICYAIQQHRRTR